MKHKEIIRMQEISHSRVLRNANINVLEREAIGLLGLNNTGKSEILQILCGFMQQDSGKLYIDEKEAPEYSPTIANAQGIQYIHSTKALSLIHIFFQMRMRNTAVSGSARAALLIRELLHSLFKSYCLFKPSVIWLIMSIISCFAAFIVNTSFLITFVLPPATQE